MPINLMTLHQLWGVTTPEEARQRLSRERVPIDHPTNLEEWVLSQVGHDIYEALIRGYTTKQWGRDPSQLPASIVKRLPIRLTWDDNYFDDAYQGIPVGGYTRIFDELLEGCDVHLCTDFLAQRDKLEDQSLRTVYTGPIDAFYDHCFGELEYRTLNFETKILDVPDYQGLSQLNYTSADVPWTRVVEHKHFESAKTDHTVVTWERPARWHAGAVPYYPINDVANEITYNRYRELSHRETRTVFGGRLASYKYRDMHQVIAEAMALSAREGLTGS
jgi:UDP-galactopyranose mutase